MHSVRSKLLAIVAVCLVPMAVTTVVFSWAADQEIRADAKEEIQAARRAFAEELRDDVGTLRVATRLISTDPDLLRELAGEERAILYEHIDDFSNVYPDIRVYLTDPRGTLLATSHEREAHGSLAAMPELQAALAGRPSQGVTRLVLDDGSGPVAEAGYCYALVMPIDQAGKRLGALVATFRLNGAYLDATERKEGLALAVRVGGELVAWNRDFPDPEAVLADHEVKLETTPTGRVVVMTGFRPGGIGATRADVIVLAAKDITEQFRDSRRFLLYRLLALLAVAAVALVTSLLIGKRIAQAIQRLARVLPGVALHRYEPVTGVQTGDELQALAETYNAMILQLREGTRLREALGKYLSRAARDAIEHGQLELGGTTLAATVLFCDIRGFTRLSEKMDPERVLALLNRYFTEMVASVVHHHGIVDKFIGDCIMAVWGPPEPRPDDARNAVLAALEMRERLASLNLELAREGIPPIHTGVGIHTGEVVAGNMGAASSEGVEGKMEYTVIGDTVNLASRLEALTKELHVEILLSEETHRQVASEVEAVALDRVQVRGREQQVSVYKLIGLRPVTDAASVARGPALSA